MRMMTMMNLMKINKNSGHMKNYEHDEHDKHCKYEEIMLLKQQLKTSDNDNNERVCDCLACVCVHMF